MEKGEEKAKKDAVIALHKNGVPVNIIATSLNMAENQVLDITKNHV